MQVHLDTCTPIYIVVGVIDVFIQSSKYSEMRCILYQFMFVDVANAIQENAVYFVGALHAFYVAS